MSDGICSICFNLDETALNALHWRDTGINFYPLRTSASKCQYCKILLDGILALRAHEKAKTFSVGLNGTLRLVLYDLLKVSGVNQIIEFYRETATSSEQASDQPSVLKGAPTSAIKYRPRPTSFWDESVRSQLQRWTGEPPKATVLPRRVLDLGVGTKQLARDLRLVEISAMRAPYVASAG